MPAVVELFTSGPASAGMRSLSSAARFATAMAEREEAEPRARAAAGKGGSPRALPLGRPWMVVACAGGARALGEGRSAGGAAAPPSLCAGGGGSLRAAGRKTRLSVREMRFSRLRGLATPPPGASGCCGGAADPGIQREPPAAPKLGLPRETRSSNVACEPC